MTSQTAQTNQTKTMHCRYCGSPEIICHACQVCQACANPKPAAYVPPAPGEPGSWSHAVDQLGGMCPRCGLFICSCDQITGQPAHSAHYAESR